MKKKFMRKILGVFLSFMLVILPMFSVEIEEVSAADDCKSYTNYYFFLYVADLMYFDGITSTQEKAHSAWFPYGLPENVDETSAKLTWIDFNSSSSGWTIKKFWEKYLELVPNGLDDDGSITKEGNTWYFIHSKEWFGGGDGEIKDSYTDPANYTADVLENSSYYHSSKSNGQSFKLTTEANDNGEILLDVLRTIGTDWQDLVDAQKDEYNAKKHPTGGNIWMPALLKVDYLAECSTATDTQQYKITTKYVHEDTNETLRKDDVRYSNAGDTYNIPCTEQLTSGSVTYDLVSDKTITGTMPAKDIVLYCKYNGGSGGTTPTPTPTNTYKVTVNYLDKNTMSQIKAPSIIGTNYKNGDSYSTECPGNIGSNYILATHSGNLNGKINNKDVVINCLYTTESPKTSDIPIYIVWGIGGAALVYSIYYFRKYYKQPNNA